MNPIPRGVTRHPPRAPNGWLGYERSTGWRLDAATDTFVGRPLTQHDALRWTYDDFGPEPLLRLGAPGPTPPAGMSTRWSPSVHKFGLQVLNAAGFINGNVPPEHMNQSYDPKGMLSTSHTSDPIHPVLRRDMWANITDHQWTLIEPGLHLATAILDTPDCLKFFWAYLTRYKWTYSPHLGRNIKIVELPSYLSSGDLKCLYKKITELRSFTSFNIGDAGSMPNTLARTDPLLTQGFLSGTVATRIEINPHWFAALEFYADPTAEQRINDYQRYHGMDTDRHIHISAGTTRLNVLVQFAQVIVHELSHAVVATGVNIAPDDENLDEPFFQADRTCEAGYALERHIFGGHISGYLTERDSIRFSLHAPYGMNMVHDVECYKQGKDPPPQNELFFPVPAVWGASLFSKMHWDMVDRFGAGYLKVPEFNEWVVWRD